MNSFFMLQVWLTKRILTRANAAHASCPQKEGKKRMKAFGSVNLPQEAFIEVLKA
jgi:hypothetical protein